MTLSVLTLLINSILVLIGIVLAIILLRIGAIHDYHYGMSDVQGPLRRWMLVILFTFLIMSFLAAVYNLFGPWLFGL